MKLDNRGFIGIIGGLAGLGKMLAIMAVVGSITATIKMVYDRIRQNDVVRELRSDLKECKKGPGWKLLDELQEDVVDTKIDSAKDVMKCGKKLAQTKINYHKSLSKVKKKCESYKEKLEKKGQYSIGQFQDLQRDNARLKKTIELKTAKIKEYKCFFWRLCWKSE